MQLLFDFVPFIPDAIGILGVMIVLWYYVLLQLGKRTANSLSFSIGNFIGAILILISLYYNWNLSSFIIELVWCLISAYGIFKYFSRPMI